MGEQGILPLRYFLKIVYRKKNPEINIALSANNNYDFYEYIGQGGGDDFTTTKIPLRHTRQSAKQNAYSKITFFKFYFQYNTLQKK